MHPPISNSEACTGSALGLLFRQTRDAMWARMERELAAAGHELTFSQFMAMKKLTLGIASVTDLARAADLNPGAMTRLLDKLEARGLLVRVADPGDRRALHIHLTEAGRTMWRDIDQCGQRVRERALHGMDEATRTHLTRLLEQVRDNLLSQD
ncbi:MarR family winged helix-turn-helix transcriptional regulator [Thermomonas sp.]|uniref:MarR family winged helix-turn-helix transcriptional regulator n=1 Tax=Thermomonas sp. TaxID=1971895 RepID=UPI0035AE5879